MSADNRWLRLLVADRMALVVDLQAWNPHYWSEMSRYSHKRSQMCFSSSLLTMGRRKIGL